MAYKDDEIHYRKLTTKTEPRICNEEFLSLTQQVPLPASGYHYRWTGSEKDDDGNFKIPAEAFERLEIGDLLPLETANTAAAADDNLVLVPKDKDFFEWQKQASEFKSCNQTNVNQKQSHPKGKKLTNQKEIDAYMKRCPSTMYKQLYYLFL